MAWLKWLGEDDLHGDAAGPSFTTAFGGIKFPKGEAVEVTDENALTRARKNPFFSVSDLAETGDAPKRGPGRPRKEWQSDVQDEG